MNQIRGAGMKILWGTMAFLILGYGGYRYYLLDKKLQVTEAELRFTTEELTGRVQALEADLSNTTTQKQSLEDTLLNEKEKSASLGEIVETITGKVQTLEKLTQTDLELLKKYSKVYFLSEHYVPKSLITIDPAFVLPKERVIQVHAQIALFLNDLLQAAANESLQLRVLSGYRSFEEQKSLKSAYTVTYGSGANRFSADQGYSEHQLGTTVDFTTVSGGSNLSKLETAPEYKWLSENAYRYGFVLSYPKNNTYYKYEPWHWRFVGTALATKLHSEGKFLYDLDQREIDAYLITLFDR